MILRKAWSAVFVLRAATWPFDLTNLGITNATGNESAFVSLQAARTTISNLRLDDTELSILETFALCRPGKRIRSYLFFLFFSFSRCNHERE